MGILEKFKKHQNASPKVKYPVTALKSYTANNRHEISFKEGDQLMVVDDSQNSFYQVYDPTTKAMGLVEKSYFTKQVVQRLTPLFAISLFDFAAETPDELALLENEQIMLISKVNEEWYLAKAMNRIATGLVPVTYVEVRDPKTGRILETHEVTLPSIDEWKLQNKKFQEKAIPLGKRKIQSAPVISAINNVEKQTGDKYLSMPEDHDKAPRRDARDEELEKVDEVDDDDEKEKLGYILEAKVPTYILNSLSQYEFIVHCTRETGEYTLLREYEDFFNLHLNLLQGFPEAAGRNNKKRIIPFLAGPVETVTKEVTERRVGDLDIYMKELLQLPLEISFSPQVRAFFRLRPNDKSGGIIPKHQNKDQIIHNFQSDDRDDTKSSTGKLSIPDPSDLRNLDATTTTSTGTRNAMSLKIKIIKGDDVIAIRCNPESLTFKSLVKKILEKLYQGREVSITIVNDGKIIHDDVSLRESVRRNREKMVVYVSST
eukprot:NODE_803_length_3808_cov_1.057381.p1 type:complete len:487 gc:universal NODE_803_length_3808_cov_1.057381:2878-1418(-)